MSISPLNIKEGEPPDTENAFVATIGTIIAIAFAMMHAPRRQMRQPPQHQKKDQQQPIHALQRTDVARFPIPPSTFAILKRGFHAPT